jgi:ABC-type Fe3+-hydroxamate transport system substrate-binding protein
VAIAIWRDPWMVVGGQTFIGDLVRRLGWANAFGDREGRYPHVQLSEIDRAGIELVLLPDEPYVFTAADGPEALTQVPTLLVSGRLLSWYGPSLVEARVELGRLLRP